MISGSEKAGGQVGHKEENVKSLFSKIVARSEVAEKIRGLPQPIVFTNGVFDILHRGHVAYLAAARDLGASLVLALNTDGSTRRLGKGPERPINAEADRALVVAGLASVDLVTFFDEDTPCALLQELRPQIYAKGGDYDMEVLEETRLVRSWGGEAHALPFVDGFSSTALIRKLGNT